MAQIQLSDLNNLLIDKNTIIGADEVGWGSCVSSLVVCGIKAPKGWKLEGLNDSKKLTPKKRELMRDKILKCIFNKEIECSLVERSNEQIDSMGPAPALKDAFVEVFKKLHEPASLIITDGILKFDNLVPSDYVMASLIKGDSHVQAIMAASIIAKTFRDDKLRELHKLYPQYGWDTNFGYANPEHIANIRKHGLSPLHRRSYKIKSLIDLYET